MKRITFLTAAFLCLSGLTESPAQDTQSNRNMEELKLTHLIPGRFWTSPLTM